MASRTVKVSKVPRRARSTRLPALDQRAITVHEAGHAVAAYLLKLPFHQVFIGRQSHPAGGSMLGGLELKRWRQCSIMGFDWLIERHVMVCHAGPIAQMMFTGSSAGDLRDAEDAERLLRDKLRCPPEEIKPRMDALFQKTMKLMTRPGAIHAVADLSRVLQSQLQLDRKAARAIIRQSLLDDD